jgi:hypothetical protein
MSIGPDVDLRHAYGNLTPARPFDYLSSWNFTYLARGSVHFGIATSDVAAVSLIGPDGSVTPAVLRDGTFLAETKFAERKDRPTGRIRVTLKNAQVLEDSFR